MKKIYLRIPEKVYNEIRSHLIPVKAELENSAFIFVEIKEEGEVLEFLYKDWYAVGPEEYTFQSAFHIEHREEVRPKIIKKAFDRGAAVVELHSHPSQVGVGFSGSDMIGFQDYVPHFQWKLEGKHYAEIVM